MKIYTPEIIDQMENILNIGIALTTEKNHPKLLEMILTEARKVTHADAGTLYMYENNQLVFKIMHNETLQIFKGGDQQVIDLPPVTMDKGIVSAYVALTKKSVNISDVYNTSDFDFSGPKHYDQITGYKTTSMLVTPLENNEGKVIGVLQLLNAKDENGKIIPFAPHLEKVIFSLASQAAIALSNMQYLADIERLLHSFVEVMATTIDARSPYNANHTRRVVKMTEALASVLNQVAEGSLAHEHFSEERKKQLMMAAWLHDIGKIATPSRVMDKATRLEERLELILQRLDYIAAMTKLTYLEKATLGKDCTQKKESELTYLQYVRKLIIRVNNPITLITDELLKELEFIANKTYIDWQGKSQPWLTTEELKALSVRCGTLTPLERKVMEDHVEITRRILEIIPFPKKLENVPTWATLHHEYLDGSGYPQRLHESQIALEGRILTLVDIFDALISADRPYKKAMHIDQALGILENMVKQGKIDANLFHVFREYRVWECLSKEKGVKECAKNTLS